jgi:hypothetical protein
VSIEPSVSLVEIPESIVKQLANFGAPPAATQARLYRALANQPDLLVGTGRESSSAAQSISHMKSVKANPARWLQSTAMG